MITSILNSIVLAILLYLIIRVYFYVKQKADAEMMSRLLNEENLLSSIADKNKARLERVAMQKSMCRRVNSEDMLLSDGNYCHFIEHQPFCMAYFARCSREELDLQVVRTLKDSVPSEEWDEKSCAIAEKFYREKKDEIEMMAMLVPDFKAKFWCYVDTLTWFRFRNYCDSTEAA